jgi:HK97 family phage portal protein
VKWWKGALGLQNDGLERKEISRVEGVALHYNRDNFETNQITVATYQDQWLSSTEAALSLSAVWACVNLLAGTIASLPLMVYRDNGAGEREIARDHPLYRVLHDSPNADQTSLDFWEFMCASIELHGNAFAEIQRGVTRTALLPVMPEMVRVRRAFDGSVEYEIHSQAQPRKVRQEDMLHIRGFGGGPLGGVSTLAICRGTFSSAHSVESAASNMFANGVTSTGVFMSTRQTPLTPEQMDTARKSILEKYQGARNAGRPLLLNSDMKYAQLSINPEDAQMLETRRFGVEEVCRIFGVPPHMIGHTENSTSWGTGLEQQTLGFQKFTLRRRLKRIEQALEKQLLTPADIAAGVTIEFSLEGLLRADSKARADFYQQMTNIGAMTINEVRALENMPPVEGGEVPRMQMQNVPITDAGAQPQAEAA